MTKTGPPPGVSASLLRRMAELGLIREPTHYRLVPGPGAVLDVGCGQSKWPGAIGLDISPDTTADVVADLNEFPYPLEDGRFDQILCQDVIEHVREPLRFLSELHRVAKPGARIHVRTPHFSSLLAYGDPTHEHIFSALAFRTLEHQIFPHYLTSASGSSTSRSTSGTRCAGSASPSSPTASRGPTRRCSRSATRR